MAHLPTFEEMRHNAYSLLGGVQDELRTGWREGTGPTEQQAEALHRARKAIVEAKAALDRAGMTAITRS